MKIALILVSCAFLIIILMRKGLHRLYMDLGKVNIHKVFCSQLNKKNEFKLGNLTLRKTWNC